MDETKIKEQIIKLKEIKAYSDQVLDELVVEQLEWAKEKFNLKIGCTIQSYGDLYELYSIYNAFYPEKPIIYGYKLKKNGDPMARPKLARIEGEWKAVKDKENNDGQKNQRHNENDARL